MDAVPQILHSIGITYPLTLSFTTARSYTNPLALTAANPHPSDPPFVRNYHTHRIHEIVPLTLSFRTAHSYNNTLSRILTSI